MELTEEILRDALHYGKAFTKLGRTAQYIPELRAVNRYYLGICTMDLDGNVLKSKGIQGAFYDPEYLQAGVSDPCDP